MKISWSVYSVLEPVFPAILKCLILQDFLDLNVTQLLIGKTMWFSQSEFVLENKTKNDLKNC